MPSNPLGLPIEYAYRGGRHSNEVSAGPRILWRPQDPESTPMSRYRQHVNRKYSTALKTSHDLHRWSVTQPHTFWIDLYQYTGIIPALPLNLKYAYDIRVKMADKPEFFPGHKVNYAENVLVPNFTARPYAIALTGLREGALDHPEHITWTQLWDLVKMTRSALLHSGLQEHDVVAAHMSNSVWIIVLFLATASVGAYFTSVSPDMGVPGCISRLSQVRPKILFSDIDCAIRGTRHNLLGKVLQMQKALAQDALPIAPQTVFVPTTHQAHLKQNVEYVTPLGVSLYSFLSKFSSNEDELTFHRVPTSHPLVVLYSSGTTGSPKCILSPHISILNYKKIAYLHNSLSSASTVFQYSSTSWVVWNIMLGHLSVGARLITYDGGALHPSPATLLEICDKYNVTYWGTSPRYLLELEQSASTSSSSSSEKSSKAVAAGVSKAGIDLRKFDLRHLKMVTTTGATLTGPQMRWFYTAFPSNVHLSSIAGGTEICSSWIASDPAGPLYENEMQMWALGHDCDVADSITGESLIHSPSATSSVSSRSRITQQKQTHPSESVTGELVCRQPFVSLPVGFWNDVNNQRYKESYFQRFPVASAMGTFTRNATTSSTKSETSYLDIWTQHDITTYNPTTHGIQITARSDSTLNPSGIRFGPSEIYSVLSSPTSALKDKISDALCVGRKRNNVIGVSPHQNPTTRNSNRDGDDKKYADNDETVFLFVTVQPPHRLDAALELNIRTEIAQGLSPRHVPKFIYQTPPNGIPYTVNGKKVEVLVKKIISGDISVVDRDSNDDKPPQIGETDKNQGMTSTIVNPECLSWYTQFVHVEQQRTREQTGSGKQTKTRTEKARL